MKWKDEGVMIAAEVVWVEEKEYWYSEEYQNEEGKHNTDLADEEVHFLEATVIVESSKVISIWNTWL